MYLQNIEIYDIMYSSINSLRKEKFNMKHLIWVGIRESEVKYSNFINNSISIFGNNDNCLENQIKKRINHNNQKNFTLIYDFYNKEIIKQIQKNPNVKFMYYSQIYSYDSMKKLGFLKSIGANTISPNMELWEQEDLDKFCSVSSTGLNVGTTKSEIGHNGYIDFIKAGIDVFGKYNVRTSLIVGLNSKENVKKAIKDLIPLGCYVVISPFKSPSKYFNQLEPNDYDLIELSNYLKCETDRVLNSFPSNLTHIYKERISNSLNAHNSHNTANLCCGQNLDIIEQQALSLGKDNHIVSMINNNDE